MKGRNMLEEKMEEKKEKKEIQKSQTKKDVSKKTTKTNKTQSSNTSKHSKAQNAAKHSKTQNSNSEKYKKEQEILIYFNGIVEDLFPARIIHVGKIEIKKEKSDAIIPENILTTYYNTINNSQGD